MITLVILTSLIYICGAVTPLESNFHPIPNFLKQSTNRNSLLESLGANKYTPEEEANTEFWINLARKEVDERVNYKPVNLNKAKNIIFFLGDGMSLSTVTAARIRKGQLKGKTGEEEALSFEKFPHMGLSKTYCANAQVPDSACTATAYLCGIKNNIITIGVNAKVNFNNCSESENPNNHVSSIAAWAQKAGKSTGFITTTTLTHASPAGSYAHTANRFWECDADITASGGLNDPSQCTDIAQQLILNEPGRNFDLMMGGGMGKFLPNHITDLHGNKGERLDNKNLLSLWQGLHPKGVIVQNRNNLLNLNISKVSHIMGLFQSQHMDYYHTSNKQKQPTLEEMTEISLKFLSKNEKGYFIFIEGGKIDSANHANMVGLSIDETLEMEKAIQKARDITDPNETLIVVSSDHSHPLSIAGYPGRGTNILVINQHDTDVNGIKYATLNYAAGTQQYLNEQGKRLDIENRFGEDLLAVYPSYINTEYGVHGGEDVGIYSSGPHEHLFRGVMEQHAIPHLMAYAACIGEGRTMCDNEV